MFVPFKDLALASCTVLLWAAALTAQAEEHKMMHKQVASAQSMAEVVSTSGVVKGVLAETNQLKVQHQRIPEWDMRQMQMKFNLAPGLQATDFQEGQEIRFRLQQQNMMTFTITDVADQ
ncbi:copper-binding protein [Aliamphritea ceti]|uniref:copper-binding protein n=1 Tax=Aliamphritea ceti TaxID=1524258 RepID=UPI0021C49BB5|nr:copper-binding protein [Aliamphritea ceti]